MENKKEGYYIAVIIYKSTENIPDDKPVYQECFTFIKASCLEEAEEKALNYGKKEEHSYKNAYGNTVTWKMIEIVDVNTLLYNDVFDDLTDFHARFFTDYEAYKKFTESRNFPDEDFPDDIFSDKSR